MTTTSRDSVPHIFICHSQEDSTFCLQLAQDLRKALDDENAVWCETDGEVAWATVVQELTGCHIFIVILSPASMASLRIQREIDLAWEQKNSPQGKEIIPVLYHSCNVRPDLRILQMINLLPPRKYEVEFGQLLKSIWEARMLQEAQSGRGDQSVDAQEELGLTRTPSEEQDRTKGTQIEGHTRTIGRRTFVAKTGLALGAAFTLGIIVYSRISSSSAPLMHTPGQSVSRVRWRYETTGPITDTPVVVNGIVYVTSQDGYLYALDTVTGKRRWSYRPPDQAPISQVFSAPTVVNEVVYAAWGDQFMYALDAGNGQLRWRYATPPKLIFPRFSAPTVEDGVVYASSSDRYLVYAFDGSQGKLLARYSLMNIAGGFRSPPTVAGGVIYLNTVSGHVYAFDTRDQRLLWDASVTEDVPTALVVSNGFVYFGSQDHLIYAIDAKTGAFRWQYITGDYIRSAPAVFNGTLYAGSADQSVYALDASNGKRRWSYRVGAPIGSSPALVSGRVYVTADDRALYALDADGGRFLWRYPVGNDILTSPQIADSTAYIGCADNTVYALNIP